MLSGIRRQKFTIGWAWTSDYGSSENPDAFKALVKAAVAFNAAKAKR